jgi:hypothetical protein
MKRSIISALSAMVLITLVIGVIPAVAAGSKGENPESSDYIPEGSLTTSSYYSPWTTWVGEPLLFTLSATDPDGDGLIYSASNLPPGATFDPQTRTFSWTPGYDQAGVYPDIHFEVSDGELTDSEDITITVYNSNRPPSLDFIGDKLVKAEERMEINVNATDPDGDGLVYSASNLPPGATFDSETRTFSWKPALSQRGSYSGVRFKASDGELTGYEDITITVTTAELDALLVSNLKIYPRAVSLGKKVNIRVMATNTGTVNGNFILTLRVNGIIEDKRVVSIAAGESREVRFVISRNIAGLYMVDVNGVSGFFVVSWRNWLHRKIVMLFQQPDLEKV